VLCHILIQQVHTMPIRLAQVGLIFLDSYVSRAFIKISGISNSIQEVIYESVD
jgi:hypothetical protein